MNTAVAKRVRRARTGDTLTGQSVVTVQASGVCVENGDRRDIIEVTQFVTEPAYVRVSAGVTKKLADYESLRVDVSMSVPCYVEEIDTVFPRVAARVSELLTEEVEAYLGDE